MSTQAARTKRTTLTLTKEAAESLDDLAARLGSLNKSAIASVAIETFATLLSLQDKYGKIAIFAVDMDDDPIPQARQGITIRLSE